MVQYARSAQTRGTFGQSSRHVGRDAMDTSGAQTKRADCGRSSRVVVVPRRWDQPPGQEPGGTEANKPGTPARARSKPKTIVQGMPDRPVTCGDYARVLFCFRTRGCGRIGARHSLRPRSEGQRFAEPGQDRAAGTGNRAADVKVQRCCKREMNFDPVATIFGRPSQSNWRARHDSNV